jgi:hypothetical protein
MTAEPGEPAGADVTLGGAATTGIARWHGTDGLRADAHSVLEQRRLRGADAVRRATATESSRPAGRSRHGVPT